MDLAKRLRKVITDNQGTLVFVRSEKPTVGWVTVRKMTSYQLSGMSNTEVNEAIRSFLVANLLVSDGVAVYRRSGRMTLAQITLFPTLAEAEVAARSSAISHIVDVATNVSTQVGDFEPNVPGDGVVEV